MRLLITTQVVDKNDPILGFFHAWILEFAKYFDHIDVICLTLGENTLPENVRVYSLGKEERKGKIVYLVRFYRYFWSCYMSEHVDFVFYHMGALYNILAIPFFLLRTVRKTRFFWWKTHGKIGALKEQVALFCVDSIYTAGTKSFDKRTPKLKVVGHAIDTDYFVQDTVHSHEIKRLLLVGRIVPIKKIEVAIRALSTIVKVDPRVTCEIIGPTDNPTYYEKVRAYAKEYGVLDNMVFSGPQSPAYMPNIYAQGGILLHPAYEAGFDKVVLEAMASGVIPITSIPSFKAVLQPFDLFASGEDDETYARIVLNILRMKESDRSALRHKLRDIVARHHSLDTLPGRIFGLD